MLAVTLKAHTHTSPPPGAPSQVPAQPAGRVGPQHASLYHHHHPQQAGTDGSAGASQPAQPTWACSRPGYKGSRHLLVPAWQLETAPRHISQVSPVFKRSGLTLPYLPRLTIPSLFSSPTLFPFPLPFFRLYKLSHLSCCQPVRLHCSLPLVLRFRCSCLARKGAPFHLPRYLCDT